jgi:hypothetical protein
MTDKESMIGSADLRHLQVGAAGKAFRQNPPLLLSYKADFAGSALS